MNYEKIYEDLVTSRKGRGLTKESGFEIHHIIPCSFGGSNSKENLVKLTFREHYIAHKLLALKYKGVSKDKYSKSIYALWIIGNSKDKVRNSREYEWVKGEYERVTVPKLRVMRSHPKDVFRTYHNRDNRFNILRLYLNTSKGGTYGKALFRHYYVRKSKTVKGLMSFLDFCAAVYSLGFDKISLSVDFKRFHTHTEDLLVEEKTSVGSHFRFTDKFKSLYHQKDCKPSVLVLNRCMVQGKPLAGTRGIIAEWNKRYPDKLVYGEIVDGLTKIYPLNNWDITGIPYLTQPLDYNTLREFRLYITEKHPSEEYIPLEFYQNH